MRILIVEDDVSLQHSLVEHFKHQGFVVDTEQNGIDALHMGLEEQYDAVILDLGLPGKSGLEVLKAWRDAAKTLPVLILTARDAWYQRVEGLKAGADDYLGKPFHLEELQARLEALIRRDQGHAQPILRIGDFTLDEERQELQHDNGDVRPLTATEFRLLRYFLHNRGKLLSKSHLTDHIYAYDHDRDSNVIEVYIKRLRAILGKDIIETRRGQGYIFQTESNQR